MYVVVFQGLCKKALCKPGRVGRPVNQCLRCKKPCGDNEDFCEDCRSHLHSGLQQDETQSRALPSKQVIENVLAGARSSREAGEKTISASLECDAVDLNDEDLSTPGIPALPVSEEEDADSLEDENTEEDEMLPDEADPLLTRHLPGIAESILIEEEDIQRAIEQGEYMAPDLLSSPKPRLPGKRPLVPQSLRLAFFLLSVVTILALIGGGVVAFLNPSRQTVHATLAKALPALTVTPGIVHADQIVLLHMNNFSPLAKIRLTHDTQETVRTDTGSPFSVLSANGDGDARILVDDTWAPGSHIAKAEDVVTHYTASGVLHVLYNEPSRTPN